MDLTVDKHFFLLQGSQTANDNGVELISHLSNVAFNRVGEVRWSQFQASHRWGFGDAHLGLLQLLHFELVVLFVDLALVPMLRVSIRECRGYTGFVLVLLGGGS